MMEHKVRDFYLDYAHAGCDAAGATVQRLLGGEIGETFIVFRDISERRRLERELLDASGMTAPSRLLSPMMGRGSPLKQQAETGLACQS